MGLKDDLKKVYKSCDECLTNSISKPAASYAVIPTSLQVLQPNEMVHLDYCEVNGTDILVVKCKSTDHNWARITPNKTGETTIKMFERYMTTFDHPRIVVTDHGPAFSSNFVDFLNSNHIIHHYRSYYRPRGNDPAERGVRSIKDVMRKIPNFSKRNLRAAVFAINQHQAADESGSPAQRFFKRHVRSNLPMLITKELKHEDLMKIRSDKQQKLAKKQGRRSSDTFLERDSVRIQNMKNCCWDKSGVIKEVRRSDDGQGVSFIISLPDGKETIRHRSHLRYSLNRYTRISDTKVRFDLEVNRNGEERKKEERKKVVQPLKLQKSKSSENSEAWEIANNHNKDDETGIAAQTRSKCAIDMSGIPLKSALKRRTLEN